MKTYNYEFPASLNDKSPYDILVATLIGAAEIGKLRAAGNIVREYIPEYCTDYMRTNYSTDTKALTLDISYEDATAWHNLFFNNMSTPEAEACIAGIEVKIDAEFEWSVEMPFGEPETVARVEAKPESTPQPEPKPERKPKTETNGREAKFSLNLNIEDVVREMVDYNAKSYIDTLKGHVEELIDAEVAKRLPTTLTINEVEMGSVEGRTHKLFEKAVKVLRAVGQIYLGGPTGSGKTYLAEQIAKVMGLEYKAASVTAGISEGHLLGRMLMNGEYVTSDFVRLYENGGVFLLDEFDAMDQNTALILNSAISNGYLFVPNRRDNHTAERHPDFYLVASGNTWGNGSHEYTGREVMDKSVMARFDCSKIKVDYDEELEREIAATEELADRLHAMRRALTNTSRHISTRTFVDANKLIGVGFTIDEVVEAITVDFSEAEKELLKNV